MELEKCWSWLTDDCCVAKLTHTHSNLLTSASVEQVKPANSFQTEAESVLMVHSDGMWGNRDVASL